MIVERLKPETDLKTEIARICREHSLEAGVVVCSVGSLSRFSLRFAGRKEATTREGAYEILSLNGTVSVHGLHLHLSVSDENGGVIGGHLMEGCQIRTTAEIGIEEVPNVRFRREIDPVSGYRELKIEVI